MDTPVATGLIWLQDKKLEDKNWILVSFTTSWNHFWYCFGPLNFGLQLGMWYVFFVFVLFCIMTSRIHSLGHHEWNLITELQTAIILSLWLTLNMSRAPWNYYRPRDQELAQQLSNCQNPQYFPTIELGFELGIDQCFICQTVDHIWNRSRGQRLWRRRGSLATRTATVM